MFFLWGTDWEDQPLTNAQRLAKSLPCGMYDWRAHVRASTANSGLFKYFGARTSSPAPPAGAEPTALRQQPRATPAVKLKQPGGDHQQSGLARVRKPPQRRKVGAKRNAPKGAKANRASKPTGAMAAWLTKRPVALVDGRWQ